MFKFLRKYNKFILAVGGTLLLIVFLIPQAIQQLSQQAALRSADVATVGLNNEDVSITRWQEVQAESQVVQNMENMGLVRIPGVDRIKDASHWYLLTREAEQLGFVPTQPTGQLAMDDATLLRMSAGLQASPQLVQQTMAKIQGVSRMISTYLQTGEMSDRRLQQYAQRLFHAVGLRTVVVRADADGTDFSPTEQQLRDQLEKYKDVSPGEGDHGFGYRLPDRVRLEWLTIPAEAVRDAIANSDRMTGRVLRRHWNENQGQRGIPDVPDEPTAVPDVVRDDLLEQLTQQELDQIEKFAYDEIRIPQRGLSRSGGFYTLPDDWSQRRADLQELATSIADRFNIPTPDYHAPGEQWTNVDDLDELEGIGQAQTDKFGRLATTLSGIVARAKEFGGDGTIPIQEGLAGPPLRGDDGSVYVMRLTATSPSHPPQSIDPVRSQLVEDLRRQAHYQQLVKQTQQMEQTAATDGMLALAQTYDSEVAADQRAALYEPDKYYIDTIRGQGLDAQPSQVPGLGNAPQVLGRIIDWARTFPPDAKMSTIPVEQRIRAFDVDDRFAIVVVMLTRQYPLTQEDYKALTRDGQLGALMLAEELGQATAISEAFSYDALAARHHFKPSQSRTADDTDDAPATGDAETNATSDGDKA